MVRDVFIASMSKGQFPLAILGILAMIIILKMPSEDISNLAAKFIGLLSEWKIVGYVGAIFLAFGWFFHSKFQRRTFSDEVRRISEERNILQEKLTGKKNRSSR